MRAQGSTFVLINPMGENTGASSHPSTESKGPLIESNIPTSIVCKHYLDQISDKAFYQREPLKVDAVNVDKPSVAKTRLDVTVSINEILEIDTLNDCYTVKLRLYMMWPVDLHALGMETVAAKAQATGHHANMSENEISTFKERYDLPEISLFNAIETDDSDPESIRVYGGDEGNTALLWNKGYKFKCMESFELQDFPFDHQDLQLNFRQNNSKTWDLFDLTVNIVQFHKNSLTLSEWTVCEPQIKRGSPSHKETTVSLKIKRHYLFYIQNIILTQTSLSLLGLLTFAMDLTDIGTRVGTILQLILTAVAFKFILAQSLPKVPYNTIIDWYMMSSFVTLAITALLASLPGLLPFDTLLLNKTTTIIAAIFIFFTQMVWMLLWLRVSWGRSSKKIDIVDGKNWYAFRFSTPPYLPDI